MSWFYNTTLYYKFRYYFIRKKAPLSWMFWGDIMHRQSSSQGMYAVNVASAGDPDCAISLSRGAPGDNNIEICVYDAEDNLIDTVLIPLTYRQMGRVMSGFDKAFSVSRKKIREELGDA